MTWKNAIFFSGLWVYMIIVVFAHNFFMGLEDLFPRIPEWAYPLFVFIIPLAVPITITYKNRQREKRGHKDFGFMDAIGKRKVEPHETKEYQKATYPPIDRRFLSGIPKDLVLGIKGLRYIYCPLSHDGMNAFLVGNIGSGKSSFLKTWMLTCLYRNRISIETGRLSGIPYNFFCIDIKGELYEAVLKIDGHYRAEEDQPIQVVQPSNRDSWGYDVFYRVHRSNVTETEQIKVVNDIAEALVEESGDNPYFSSNARKILRGVLFWGICKRMEFVDIIQQLLRNNFDELVTSIVEEAESERWTFVFDNLKTFVGKKDNESIQDILTTMYDKLACFSSYPDIVYALKDNPYRTSPAALDDGITCLDLAVEQSMLETYAPLFRLVSIQVLKHCENYQESDKRNTQLIIDEASRIGYINGLDGMMATLRSKHVGIVLAFQSIHQFLDIYREHRAQTILSLCELKIFLSGDGDEETTKYVAGMAGKYVTEKRSYQKDTMLGQKELKYNEDLRDIIDTQSMMELKERGEAIAFIFGHYFRFKKVVYYKDRILGPIYKEIDVYNKAHIDRGIE